MLFFYKVFQNLFEIIALFFEKPKFTGNI